MGALCNAGTKPAGAPKEAKAEPCSERPADVTTPTEGRDAPDSHSPPPYVKEKKDAPATRRSRGADSSLGPAASSDPALLAISPTSAEDPTPKALISRHMLGEPPNFLRDALPDWQYMATGVGPGHWKSYSLEDSITLDRYWKVYKANTTLHAANVRIMKKEALVDFAAMTCALSGPAGGRPRKLQRCVQDPGWLSNRYFWDAFKSTLLKSGVKVDSAAEEIFDFRYNQDFREMKDDGRELMRGGQLYKLPIGWKRFAVNVKGQYDDGANAWLREDDSGWAVAYHGTTGESLPGILSSGFRLGGRQRFEKSLGKGIYCTPFIDIAQHYSKPQKMEGHSVQIVLQLRVRPTAIKRIAETMTGATEFEKKYWIINEPKDLRAYGVLIRELPLRSWVPPEVMVFGKDSESGKKVLADLAEEVRREG